MVLTELSAFIPEDAEAEQAAAGALRRHATPEDVAGAVLMMASGHAGYVTGTELPVLGGARIA